VEIRITSLKAALLEARQESPALPWQDQSGNVGQPQEIVYPRRQIARGPDDERLEHLLQRQMSEEQRMPELSKTS
jgi:hypothetical protein